MNDRIKEARDVGLRLLDPCPRDLEHGLELHTDSLVFDAYGFAPSAAPDADAYRAAAEAGASDIELEDLYENQIMTRAAIDSREREEFMEAWDAAGVTCVFQNAGQEGPNPLVLLKRLAHFVYASDLLRDFAPRAVCPDDIDLAAAEGRHCFYMTENGVPLTLDWVSVEGELRYVRVFFQLGVRMMHLTYNRRNMIGDGCGEAANGGLSDFGRAAVRELNRVGVIPDVAHSGFQTSLEAAQVSERPVVASHSGAHALSPHFRCKPDDVIRALADSGGYIGVCAIPGFLGGRGDITVFLDHIEYLVQKFGADHVAIGTDVAHMSSQLEAARQKLPKSAKRRAQWSMLWPDMEFMAPQWQQPDQVLSLAWTNWPLFTVGMVQRGFADEDIRKILGGNVMRVARATWDARTP